VVVDGAFARRLRGVGAPAAVEHAINLQLEAFIALSGGFVAGSLDELVKRLAELRAA
jgi:hypothetical protein